MTLRPEDFAIDWATHDPKHDKPASRTEILDAIEEINNLAPMARNGVVKIHLRTPVAVAVCDGLNHLSPGTAAVDIGRTPKFQPEKGGCQSVLTVARSHIHMKYHAEEE